MSSIVVQVPVLVSINTPMQMRKVEVADPAPHEVRVKMTASGVCHSCLHAYDGSHPAPLPIILGDEGAGVIESVGSAVTTLLPGDHVIISWLLNCGTCPQCLRGKPAYCQGPSPFGAVGFDGTSRFTDVETGKSIHHYAPSTYSPYIVVPATSAIKIRKDMPLDKAALLGCSVTTGFGAVTNAAQARPGDSVAVFGCGGVGLNSIQGARVVGANPIIAVDTSDAALEMAVKLGATHTVNPKKVDVEKEIFKIVPFGVNHTIGAVGSVQAFDSALNVLAPGGNFIILGAPSHGDRMTIDTTARILTGERGMRGSKYGSSNPAIEFPMLIELYLAGKLDLDSLLTGTYSLDESNQAFEVLAKGSSGRGLIKF